MVEFNAVRFEHILAESCSDFGDVDLAELKDLISRDAAKSFSTMQEALSTAILSACALVQYEPDYSYVSARLLLADIYEQAFGQVHANAPYKGYTFVDYAQHGVRFKYLDPRLLTYFDLERLDRAICAERDRKFQYLGLKTLADRYFVKHNGVIIEAPQHFWMRVAAGLCFYEEDPTSAAIEFYHLFSQMLYLPSTPTLFNSCTVHPQLASCFLSTTEDSIDGIFGTITENAHLQKFAGGVANDFTNVRAHGSKIKGTNGRSSGVIPFLKVVDSTAVCVDQAGKRHGAVCSYLETWHLDIEEFLELKRNVGDDRRRTHNMNTANWIPDLFMERVSRDEDWTLFSPDDVPDLHDTFGLDFVRRYQKYEQRAAAGEIRHKTVKAKDLWRKMLSMLYETGHPFVCFKDPANLRNPQRHHGVVHSSNLCTEITLVTNDNETAVCVIGSVNLAAHLQEESKDVDFDKLRASVRLAVRALDNIIDISYFPSDKARNSAINSRAIGIGQMGWSDYLFQNGIPFDSEDAVDKADSIQEFIAMSAIEASAELAAKRGAYASYQGSMWQNGKLPQDTLQLIEMERHEEHAIVDDCGHEVFDWIDVREKIARHGMRNSNVMAIAPTATIANIAGVYNCIEPQYENVYEKENLSGYFTVINRYLVNDLKASGLWSRELADEIKAHDGSVQNIGGIPDDLKALYKTAFEIDQRWLVDAAARRQAWIDQSQSVNLFFKNPTGRILAWIYEYAWKRGLKTTYYLKAKSSSEIEKSTVKVEAPKACAIDNTECETCQ